MLSELKPSSAHWGRNTRKLFGGILALGPFFILARMLTAGGQILAGRLLGPAQFGLANMIIAAAALLCIPMQLGFSNGMVKFVAMEPNPEKKSEIVSTTLWFNLAVAIPVCMVLCGCGGVIAPLLRISRTLYLWGVFYAALLSFYLPLSSMPQALTQFKERGALELVYGAGALVLFLAFYGAGLHGFESFILSLTVGLFLAGLVCLIYYKPWIKVAFKPAAAKAVSSYFLPNVITAIAGAAVGTALPLILAAYLSPAAVGILSVYEMGSLAFALVLSNIVGTILAPLSSSPERHPGAWRKFFLLTPVLFAAGLMFFSLSSAVVLELAGRHYPLRASWIVIFATASVLTFLANAATTLLSFRDASGFWLSSAGNILGGLVLVFAMFWAIPRHGIAGAGLSLVLSSSVTLLWNLGWGSLSAKKIASFFLGFNPFKPFLFPIYRWCVLGLQGTGVATALRLKNTHNFLWRILAVNEPVSYKNARFFCPPASPFLSALLYRNDYEAFTMDWFLGIIKPGMNILDIGANIGLYTVLAGKKTGQTGHVFSVEPEGKNIRILEKNIALNGLTNVSVIGKAASDQSGVTHLYLARHDYGGHSLLETPSQRGRVRIETIALDEAIPESAAIDILKIDIEGWELNAFRGMRRILSSPSLTHIFAELMPQGQKNAGFSPIDLPTEIERFGFKLFYINEKQGRVEPTTPQDVVKIALREKVINLYAKR